MSDVSQPVRVSMWLSRLNRFSSSNQPVSDFCSCEGISLSSFYKWKRHLSPTVDHDNASRKHSAKSSRSNFTELAIEPKSYSTTQIQLPKGVVIKLGSEQATVASVVAQVLLHCLPTADPVSPSRETKAC